MAVTNEELLARGEGPIQPTFMDDVEVAPQANPQVLNTQEKPTAAPYLSEEGEGAPNNPSSSEQVISQGNVNVANESMETDSEASYNIGTNRDRRNRLSYLEMVQQMNPYKPPTPEELEQERKKQKRQAIFSAIGDGISALSNLYFTTKYAPNAYDASKGMSVATRERFDKLIKDREQNQREYMKAYLQAAKMDDDAVNDERKWIHTIEREKITDQIKAAAEARAQAKADRDDAMAELRMRKLTGEISEQEYATEMSRIQKEYMEEHKQKMPTTPKPSSGGSGGRKSGRGGSGSKKEPWPAVDEDGKVHYIDGTASKDKAHAIAGTNGWKIISPTTESTTTKQNGRRTTTSTTSRTTQTGSRNKGKEDKKDTNKYSNTSKIKW